MDFGLREWLIIIGLLVIAGILFDGWRRMGGRSKIRFKLERNLKDSAGEPHDDLLGPPRVVGRPERAEPSFKDDLSNLNNLDEPPPPREPEQTGLDLGVAQDSFGEPEPPVVQPKKSARNKQQPIPPAEPREHHGLNMDDEPVDAPAEHHRVGKTAPASRKEPAARKEPSFEAEAAPAKELPPVEEVFIINVVSRDELGFPGSALLQNILESGLRYGEMNIFHRHESMSGNGDVLFSMANALKPGVFDLDEMDSTSVRAVSFFMGLPGPRHPKQALDLMIAAARKLAHELGGDLKDEQRSVLTAQTIEHYRQRIAEFERKHYSVRR